MGEKELYRAAGRRIRRGLAGVGMVLLAGCSLSDVVGTPDIPSNLTDPDATKTPGGALTVYNGALALFRAAVGGRNGFIAAAGLLGDELGEGARVDEVGMPPTDLDLRVLPELTLPGGDAVYYETAYADLQKVRGQAEQGLGLLRDFAPDLSPALRGHLFALQAYSELLLTELFCSGIPLSTVDYDGDYTFAPGSSTTEVLEHARALFDSALALAADSARILNLARVGRARTLLGLARFEEAAQSAAEVPDGFTYALSYHKDRSDSWNLFRVAAGTQWDFTAMDREGINGLDYRSSNDPRTLTRPSTGGRRHPMKYATTGDTPIVLASWIEARLIQAEAALRAGDPSWLTILNRLRQTAISPALPDTTDPGDPDARVKLLFRERAFWLYLTGHRLGDMRRLVRQYHRAPETVFAVGTYPGGSFVYGGHVDAPIPAAERQGNPLFTGCLSRGA